MKLPGFESDEPVLTCAFGGVWGPQGCGPCAGCQAESARLEANYEQAQRDPQAPKAKRTRAA